MSIANILLRTINQKNKFINIASIATVRVYHKQQGQQKQQWTSNKTDRKSYKKAIATLLFSSVILASTNKKNGDNNGDISAGDKKPGLPTYRADEVNKHDTTDSFWVIYRHGVYDVTKFIISHPGGDQIMNAAGLSIEPFWNVYGMHKTKAVYELLETFRIGNLHDDDVVDLSGDELWAMEPTRDKRLIVKTKKPFNAETPPKSLIQNIDTPNELFFVRQHMPVPELEAKTHTVKLTIKNRKPFSKSMSIDELVQLFPRAEVRATLMCAGNRRSEMNKVKEVRGINWQVGAISNAKWSGVYLRDVLVYCGVDISNTAGKHVIFEGSDIDATGSNFSVSIPLEQALNPNGRIILATHMNGKVLPKDHGYPLRVIVPGAPAVRSVKWLESITVSTDESTGHWHKSDYRSFNASVNWDTADFSKAPPIYNLPVTSAICDPADNTVCVAKNGFIEVRGYAYSGGGNKIVRVDLSPDGGKTWIAAQDLQSDDSPPTQHYSWTLWTAKIPVERGQKQIQLWAKATDNNFNTQPEKFENIWNIRGVLSNAYHRITVNIQHD